LGDGESVGFLRVFGIGLYKGSLRRLLLRSDKTESNHTRIDILFMNTQHLSLPTTMEGLEITDATETVRGESLLRECRIPVYDGTRVRVYVVTSGNGNGHVIAGSASYIEDAGEYWEPSSFIMDP